MPPKQTDRLRPDGGAPPAHREGVDSAAGAALSLDVDTTDVPVTDPETVAAALRGDDPVTILDVRGEDEVAAWRIEGEGVERTTVPASAFVDAHPDADRVRELVADLDGRPVVVVCPRGRASARVAAVLRAAGVEATNLRDGMRGWAAVSVATTVATDPLVVQYDRPSSGCLGYAVYADGEAVVVDPLRALVDRYREDAAARDAEIVAAVDTHVHADHVSGVRELAAATDARAVVPTGAVDRGLADPDRFDTVADGDRIPVGSTALEAVALPGHTSEMTGYRVDGVLFSGDSLFLESVARPDLEAGAEGAPDLARQLYETLTETIGALPDDTLLAPGHYGPGAAPTDDGGYVAPLGTVRDRLTVLDRDAAAFVERLVTDMPPRPANYREVIAVNLGRTSVDADRAFTIELGPNNCAASSDD